MKKDRKNSSGIWQLVDSLEGDKVIWMILLLLIMISILAISSSTSLLAIQKHTTRDAIIREQVFVVAAGIGLVIGLYNLKNTKWLLKASKWGYLLSMMMLIFLFAKLKLGPIRAVTLNGATRAISIFGVQLHAFEFVKIFMVMYLAWAIDAFKRDDLTLANTLCKIDRLGFLARPTWKLTMYIYFPILSVCILLLNGSGSSAIFIGGIMFLTILVGGISIKSVIPYIGIAILVFGLCAGISFGTDGKVFPRFKTMIGRFVSHSTDFEEQLMALNKGSVQFQEVLDAAKQPLSAKMAIKEGGVLGKGAGKSTQKYIVPIMFEDYMFSFIVEEYGLWGALIIIALYAAIVARGSIIVRNCDSHFAKAAVAGLVLLISGQAFMHIMINADFGPHTGQTLPLISHGKSSFLAFCGAFGIILAISRIAKTRIDKEADKARPLVSNDDSVKESLNELDQLDNL